MPEIELLYVSRHAKSTTEQVIVEDIVLPSMRFNRTVGITGCLWFGPTRFIQVIEGDEREINGLYERIKQDDRHSQVQLVYTGPITERAFARWQMKCISGEEASEIGELIGNLAPNSHHLVAPDHEEHVLHEIKRPLVDRVRVTLAKLPHRKHEGPNGT